MLLPREHGKYSKGIALIEMKPLDKYRCTEIGSSGIAEICH